MEIYEYGAIPIVLMTMYALVDKVVVPLMSKRLSSDASSSSSSVSGKSDHDRRIERNEKAIDELRAGLSEIRTKVEVSQAILKRIEQNL